MTGVAPLLVFGWGNPSRGDDALGPLFVEQLPARLSTSLRQGVDRLDDFQLQVEHALDLVGRRRVLFVDASLRCAAPFEVTPIAAARDRSYSTHAMSPQAVLQVYCELYRQAPPPATLLAIRGEAFELGAPLGTAARAYLARALDWAAGWVADGADAGPGGG